MKRTITILCIFFTAKIVLGQSYFTKDLTYRNPSVVFASFNYGQIVQGTVLPTSGTNSSLGIDVAALFKRRCVLGIMADLRMMKDFGSNKKFSKIKPDIDDNIIMSHSDPVDIERAKFLKTSFEDNDIIHFHGSYLMSYGIMYSPYPNKYGGIMIQVKRGLLSYPIYGVDNSKLLGDFDEEEFIDLMVPIKLEIQLSFKPFLFGNYSKDRTDLSYFFRNHLLLSIFYKRVAINDSELDNQSISKFLKQPFFNKNGIDHQFGFKVGVGIYR